MMYPKEFPIIQTPRLTLRPFNLSDAKEVQRMAGNPKLSVNTMSIPYPYPDGVAEEWISKHRESFEKGLSIEWAIDLSETGKLIGTIGFGLNQNHNRAEVFYWVGEDNWNQGYCTEAAIAAIQFAFKDLKLKQEFYKNGQFVDLVVYGILKED